jgi:hypothetical protein
MDLSGFNARDIEPAKNVSDVIPTGKYDVVISKTERKPTKSGNGEYLQLEFTIIQGPHADRKVWSRLNLDNPNPIAVSIAKAELSAICRAVGVLTPSDSSELQDIPLNIDIRIEKRVDTGGETNVVKGFYPAVQVAVQKPELVDFPPREPKAPAAPTAPIKGKWSK